MSASHSESSTPSQTYKLQQADLEKFYALLCHPESETFSEMIKMIEKNYYFYLLHQLKKISPAVWTASKKSILIKQINILKENLFFANKMDDKIVAAIIEDITDDGKQARILVHEDIDDFFSVLESIKSEQSVAQKNNKIPEKMSTGMTLQEKNQENFSLNYQYLVLSREINASGIKHLGNHQWAEAIQMFENAIGVESKIPAELSLQVNQETIAIYKRNLATTYNDWGIHFYSENNYENALEKYQEAINAVNSIDVSIQTKNDHEALNIFHRNKALAYNWLAFRYFNTKQPTEALQNFQAAVYEQNQIKDTYITETDETVKKNYTVNCARAMNRIAVSLSKNWEINKAIKQYEQALAIFANLSDLNAEDNEYLNMIQHNYRVAKKKVSRSNVIFFNKKRKAPDSGFEEKFENTKRRKYQ